MISLDIMGDGADKSTYFELFPIMKLLCTIVPIDLIVKRKN